MEPILRIPSEREDGLWRESLVATSDPSEVALDLIETVQFRGTVAFFVYSDVRNYRSE